MCDKCLRICDAINSLSSEEGSTITIFSENPDFGGPNNRVDFTAAYGEFEKSYFAESLVDALEVAVKELNKEIENG